MQTRSEFARYNVLFRKACLIAGLQPSRHQAGRWRKQQGTAYWYLEAARAVIAEEDESVRFPARASQP